MTMTPREVFDTVKAHLLAQGAKAEDNRICRYLDEKGQKCAVGCLISPDEYHPDMEDACVVPLSYAQGVWTSTVFSYRFRALADALNGSGIPANEEMYYLLRALQEIHDEQDPAVWAIALNDLEEELF